MSLQFISLKKYGIMEKTLRKMLTLAYQLNGRAVKESPDTRRDCSELLDSIIYLLEKQTNDERND